MACSHRAALRSFARCPRSFEASSRSATPPVRLPLRSARHSSTSTQTTIPSSDLLPPTPPTTNVSQPSPAQPTSPSKSSRTVVPFTREPHTFAHSPRFTPSRAPSSSQQSQAHLPRRKADQRRIYPGQQEQPTLSPSIRERLPLLRVQRPFYIQIHIHGKPYLVTAGDTIRLPFLMHGVSPGDILRLNKATILGSRDWTLRAGVARASQGGYVKDAASGQMLSSIAHEPIVGKTDDILQESYPITSSSLSAQDSGKADAQRFVFRKRQAGGFLDDRLFVCRATVLGTESEPMTFHEKTKPRRRKVRTMKSKLRFTVIRVTEVEVKSVEEIEAAAVEGNPEAIESVA